MLYNLYVVGGRSLRRVSRVTPSFSNTVYTIQPVVKPVVQPVWQPAVSCKQTSNWLSSRLSNRFDNRLNVCIYDTAGCQTGLTTGLTTVVKPVVQPGFTTVLNEQPLFVQPVVKPGCTTSLTTGCIHDTAVLSNRLSNEFDNRLNVWIHDTTGCQTGDNRLYCVNGASVVSARQLHRHSQRSPTIPVAFLLSPSDEVKFVSSWSRGRVSSNEPPLPARLPPLYIKPPNIMLSWRMLFSFLHYCSSL